VVGDAVTGNDGKRRESKRERERERERERKRETSRYRWGTE
jgi:hypothetical protein